ncbi:MAG: DUF2064 domain-containing protein [Cytophagaceae bacterium]
MINKKLILVFLNNYSDSNSGISKFFSDNQLHAYLSTKNIDADKYVFMNIKPGESVIWGGEDFRVFTKMGMDKCEQIENGFLKGFLKQYNRIVYVDAENPAITEKIIIKTFKKLNSHDLVLGMSGPGNVPVMGMSKFNPLVFQSRIIEKSWTTIKEELKNKEIKFNVFPAVRPEVEQFSTYSLLNTTMDPIHLN